LALDFKDGVGTREAKQRLELLYGQRSSFSIFQLDEANVLVEIHLPQHYIPNDTPPT
jgi:sensor histidine kinase YesM